MFGFSPTMMGKTISGFVAADSAKGASNEAVTIPLPQGVRDGDLLIAILSIASGARNIETWGQPAGWTKHASGGYGSTVAIFSKMASGEPDSYDWTWNSTSTHAGIVAAYRGPSGVIQVGTVSGSTSPSASGASAPSISPAEAGILLSCYGWRSASGGSAVVPAAGMVLRGDEQYTTASDGAVAICELDPSPAGSTGNKSIGLSPNVAYPTGVNVQIA